MKGEQTLYTRNRHMSCFVVFFVLMAFNTVCLAGDKNQSLKETSTYPRTPERVVEEYCRRDSEGARVGIRGTGFEESTGKYVLWKDEPGWDAAVIISRYYVKNSKVDHDTARVPVTYQELGVFLGDYTWKPKRKKQTVVFSLEKDGGQWRIAKPMTLPHVFLDTMIEELERLTKDHDERKAFPILEQLKQIKKREKTHGN